MMCHTMHSHLARDCAVCCWMSTNQRPHPPPFETFASRKRKMPKNIAGAKKCQLVKAFESPTSLAPFGDYFAHWEVYTWLTCKRRTAFAFFCIYRVLSELQQMAIPLGWTIRPFYINAERLPLLKQRQLSILVPQNKSLLVAFPCVFQASEVTDVYGTECVTSASPGTAGSAESTVPD